MWPERGGVAGCGARGRTASVVRRRLECSTCPAAGALGPVVDIALAANPVHEAAAAELSLIHISEPTRLDVI
eukprot:11830966-Prorocentrum_lima.AAC.1